MSAGTGKSPVVVLGVAGGIAAYKSIELTRLLIAEGFHVAPVLTEEATRFVGPLTFSALGSERARTSLFEDRDTPIPHTTLGQRANLVVVAPATAHLLARYAMGLATDLLGATLLATTAPVLLCPAMHTEMWEHPSVQENLATLRRRGVLVLGPDTGPLAGGDSGAGRMVEPAAIRDAIIQILGGDRGPLTGRRVLVTAGGTREAIDPVRVITNRSSGRQGIALAEVAARMGAAVTLVTAARRDVAPDVAHRISVWDVESAQEMADAVLTRAAEFDVILMAAAVSDFTVVPHDTKWKKDRGVPTIELEPTTDILAELGRRRRSGQVLVGFAAETGHDLAAVIEKRRKKGCDLIVLNDVSAEGVGFDHATNAVTIVGADDTVTEVSLRSKSEVAQAILTNVAGLLSPGDR
jgi:phosphopantothenoylcysteine decarboxylase/phosphopantothenate--cysteine ligase